MVKVVSRMPLGINGNEGNEDDGDDEDDGSI
jgi:hypothetical protein